MSQGTAAIAATKTLSTEFCGPTIGTLIPINPLDCIILLDFIKSSMIAGLLSFSGLSLDILASRLN